MPLVSLLAHFDGEHIQLDEPSDLPVNARLIVILLPEDWLSNLSQKLQPASQVVIADANLSPPA